MPSHYNNRIGVVYHGQSDDSKIVIDNSVSIETDPALLGALDEFSKEENWPLIIVGDINAKPEAW